jgi:hypothetical protein
MYDTLGGQDFCPISTQLVVRLAFTAEQASAYEAYSRTGTIEWISWRTGLVKAH